MTGRLGIVACDVVSREIEAVVDGRDIPVRVMEYALHERPKEMAAPLNRAAEEMMASGCERVGLCYGLCSNGTVGVHSRGGLTVPRCHDCISMLVGSPARYMRMFAERPGTLYVTDGWLRNAGDPLSIVEKRYTPRLGAKKAFKGMSLELANYSYICLINNGLGDVGRMRARARENCRAFNMEFVEVEADLSYFKAFVDGPWPGDDFMILGPGEKVTEDFFHSSPVSLAAGEWRGSERARAAPGPLPAGSTRAGRGPATGTPGGIPSLVPGRPVRRDDGGEDGGERQRGRPSREGRPL
ncbi:MAG: DUF1638 domain-containing protein [Deltaproteobacteria bacterium]|jgi:hypothetical protein|nr:DUF1638 domain-containing protein [Deltaproteobacteria bacterium]